MGKQIRTVKLYSAGPLFNVAERSYNLRLEEQLIRTGPSFGLDIRVILPQRKALERFIQSENRFDVGGIVEDCEYDSANSDVVFKGATNCLSKNGQDYTRNGDSSRTQNENTPNNNLQN